MNVLSLFDGMSCGQIALNRAGIKYDNYFASEIDKHAIKVTMTNYPNTIQIGSVTDVKAENLPKIDLLIGGSPCQGFSFAGKQLNFDDPRSKLFFEYIRLLKECKPKYFLLENVKMKKEYEQIITDHLGVEPIFINSALVSAQNRKRLYWTNILNVTAPIDRNILVKDIIKERAPEKYYLKMDYIYVPKETKHNSKNGLQFVCGIISKKKWLDNGKGNSRNFSQGNRIYSINGKSCTINANAGGPGGKSGLYYLEDGEEFSKKNIRRLTPLETERLQTLPDNYTACINETNRYKCVGNGWTVDVIAHIFKGIQEEAIHSLSQN